MLAGNPVSSTDLCKMGQVVYDQTGYGVLSIGRLVTNSMVLVSRGKNEAVCGLPVLRRF